ncbi:MAG: glycosyltransferase [Prevotellaceae bacterium]|jgi:glycosyltransferase involved in cell wall biosynthesis|nr:glycosyltransferase [Prevotellaceae bacterium]
MDKIRILYYGLSTKQGGIEIYLKKIFDNINKEQFELSYIKVADKVCFEEYLSNHGTSFFRIPSRKNPIVHYKSLRKIFSENHFDIVHLSINTLSYSELIFEALKHGCKVIVHSHSSNNAGSRITMILHKINKFLLRDKPITRIAVSKIAGQWLFGKHKPFSVYPNGVNTDKFSFDLIARELIRKEYNIKKDEILIGHIGHLAYPKNQSFLIKIMFKLLNINKNYKLMLVGDGADKKNLIALAQKFEIEDSIIFAGAQTHTNNFYCAFDIFAFPSFFEGFGNVVLEAQVSGLPTIVSDSIIDEIIISKNVIKMPLIEDCWVNYILNLSLNDKRIESQNVVENAGFGVNVEIKRLESLYVKCITCL